MGLSEDYTVTSTDVEAYEQSLLPLQNLSKFAAWFLLVVLLIGGVILIVFHIFNIRERKYEIGVLTAIGMRRAGWPFSSSPSCSSSPSPFCFSAPPSAARRQCR